MIHTIKPDYVLVAYIENWPFRVADDMFFILFILHASSIRTILSGRSAIDDDLVAARVLDVGPRYQRGHLYRRRKFSKCGK